MKTQVQQSQTEKTHVCAPQQQWKKLGPRLPAALLERPNWTLESTCGHCHWHWALPYMARTRNSFYKIGVSLGSQQRQTACMLQREPPTPSRQRVARSLLVLALQHLPSFMAFVPPGLLALFFLSAQHSSGHLLRFLSRASRVGGASNCASLGRVPPAAPASSKRAAARAPDTSLLRNRSAMFNRKRFAPDVAARS